MGDLTKRLLIKSVGKYVNTIALFSEKKAAEKAFQIFGTPRKGRLTEKHRAFLETASKWSELQLDGEKIQCYEWEGKGEKVLLAHGWESNSGRWKNLIKSLQKADFHIIALDAPAHGGSGSSIFHAIKYASYINHVVQHFQPKSIIGHSVGGYATVYFLSHYSHSVEKAVILGSPSDLSLILKNYANMLGYSDRVRKAMNVYLQKKFGMPVAYFKIHEFAKKLNIKGLVIHDKDDPICAYFEGEMIAKNWKDATFLTTENLGHGYQDRKVYHPIREFLK